MNLTSQLGIHGISRINLFHRPVALSDPVFLEIRSLAGCYVGSNTIWANSSFALGSNRDNSDSSGSLNRRARDAKDSFVVDVQVFDDD